MKVDPIKIEKVEQRFQRFSNYVISTPDIQPDKFINGARNRVNEFTSLGLVETVCEKFAELVQQFIDAGKMDLAGILCSRLVKFKELPFELREKYALKALEVAERQDDKIHVVARLEDLHKEYEEQADLSKMLKILTKEENALKDVIENFESAKKNFRTLVYKNENIENYEDLLATVQVDIAKIIIRKKPRKAAQKLQDAMQFFDRIGDIDRYEFAEKMLTHAEHYREAGKAAKRNRR